MEESLIALEKYIKRKDWHLIEKVSITYKDNFFIKILYFCSKNSFRTYTLNIHYYNNEIFSIKIDLNEKRKIKNHIAYINSFLKENFNYLLSESLTPDNLK